MDPPFPPSPPWCIDRSMGLFDLPICIMVLCTGVLTDLKGESNVTAVKGTSRTRTQTTAQFNEEWGLAALFKQTCLCMCAVNGYIYTSVCSTRCYFLAYASRKSKQVEQALGEQDAPRVFVWLALSRPASLGHLSSSLLQGPVRLFIEAAQVWRLPGRLFCISTAALQTLGASLYPQSFKKNDVQAFPIPRPNHPPTHPHSAWAQSLSSNPQTWLTQSAAII